MPPQITRRIYAAIGQPSAICIAILAVSRPRATLASRARAPIVAFIDDDAIAHPTLLDELVRVFDTHPDAGCVGGRIRLCLPPELPRWYNHEYAGYYSAFEPKLDDVQRVTDMADYPFGANVAYRKQAVERAGYFNEQLGRVGANTSGGEELDLEYRIAQLGCGIYVNPRAKVEHVIFPSRLRWSHVAKSAKAAGRNWAYYDIELFQQGIRFRYDLRMWIGALARMAACQNFLLAYTHSLFFQAKLLRKLRYLMPGV
jgi:GT2 family glycosyltransferase